MSTRLPFAVLTAVRPTFWQRVFHRQPKENAFIEINNLLAGADTVLDVDAAAVRDVCRRYHTTLTGPLAGRLERLYRDYLTHCLEDRQISSAELVQLSHLMTLLRIDRAAAHSIHDYVSRNVYSRSVSEVLEDGVIDSDERAFLQQLQRNLALSAREAQRIESGKRDRFEHPQ